MMKERSLSTHLVYPPSACSAPHVLHVAVAVIAALLQVIMTHFCAYRDAVAPSLLHSKPDD